MGDYYSFDGRVAEEVGVNAAVVLGRLHRMGKVEGSFKDGRVWVRASRKKVAEEIPFFSEKQVRDAINKLVNAGLIGVDVRNENPYDRTKWYSFDVATRGEA